MNPRPSRGRCVAYTGIAGVLHPSDSLYRLVHGRSPWMDGHSRYESAPVLERVLEGWPDVTVVLTSTQPWAHGLEAVLEQLGPSLAARVAGSTYDDLTKEARRQVTTPRGSTRTVSYSDADYWRMHKSDIVAAHVSWYQPERWIAIDDEDVRWQYEVRRDQLVLTDGCVGLRSAQILDRLETVLLHNFGRPNARPDMR